MVVRKQKDPKTYEVVHNLRFSYLLPIEDSDIVSRLTGER